jgi:hypothetical protein
VLLVVVMRGANASVLLLVNVRQGDTTTIDDEKVYHTHTHTHTRHDTTREESRSIRERMRRRWVG